MRVLLPARRDAGPLPGRRFPLGKPATKDCEGNGQ
jgi:hypothetical protein